MFDIDIEQVQECLNKNCNHKHHYKPAEMQLLAQGPIEPIEKTPITKDLEEEKQQEELEFDDLDFAKPEKLTKSGEKDNKWCKDVL